MNEDQQGERRRDDRRKVSDPAYPGPERRLGDRRGPDPASESPIKDA